MANDTHKLTEATAYEQKLLCRQQLLQTATEIFKAGIVANGRPRISEKEAAQRALSLMQEVDRLMVKHRTRDYPMR